MRSGPAEQTYFLNCSRKRSRWPWRVSAGRPGEGREGRRQGEQGGFQLCFRLCMSKSPSQVFTKLRELSAHAKRHG